MDGPPQRLRQHLADARDRGEPFAAAWPVAVAAALDGAEDAGDWADWATAFEQTRGSWCAAYDRTPASRAERALVAVAADPERVIPIRSRVCPSCGGDVPASRRPQAVFCSRECQRASHGRRVAA